MKKHQLLLIGMVAVLLLLAGSATAWGTSSVIRAVDDESSCTTGHVCSLPMIDVIFSQYPGAWTRVPAGSLTGPTAIGTADTVFMYGTNPNNIPQGGKTALVNFVAGGGKLIIWDGEDPCGTSECSSTTPGRYDWSFLGTQFQFKTEAPGPHGGSGGTLIINEQNQLSTSTPPYSTYPTYIDTAALLSTDAVRDSDVFTGSVASHWCVDMTGSNVFGIPSPVHIYSKDFGDGIIIWSGLDFDAATNSGNGVNLKRLLTNELTANSLPCNVVPTDLLKVDKTSDKPTYNVGDPIDFTITIQNNGPSTSYRTALVDTPPTTGVTCPSAQTNQLVGDIVDGVTVTKHVLCTATTATCKPVENQVLVTGYTAPQGGVQLFTGSDVADFTIDGPACNNPTPTPEFPTLALPVGMLLGMMFIVYSIKR